MHPCLLTDFYLSSTIDIQDVIKTLRVAGQPTEKLKKSDFSNEVTRKEEKSRPFV
jgi:hypothetical protein